MEAIYSNIADFILHFDRYLPVVMEAYGHWIYAFLFIIVFCETGLVVTPFLPGDSLLFACGALAASAEGLSLPLLTVIFLVAAITGDACNYEIGRHLGHKILAANSKLIKPEYVKKAEDFYAKHGHKAIFLARFAPIVRTFAPFVAGIGTMHYRHLCHLQCQRRLHLGIFIPRRRLLFRQHSVYQTKLFVCNHGHYSVFAYPDYF